VTVRVRLSSGAAWVLPAVPAVVVTGYLCWGAWISVRHPGWLSRDGTWWRVLLRPGDNRAILALVALWLAALICYWWPRRVQPRTVGLAIVGAMVVIGGALGASALAACRSGQTGTSAVAGILDLYVGQPTAYPVASVHACPGHPPLALQLASVVCLGATLVGALTAAAVLWRQPLERLRARLVKDATVLAGLDAMTISLLQQLARTRRPSSIVVIEPDAGHPLLDEARLTGARVMIADPTLPRVLLPVLAGGRGCALSYLYALRQDVLENEAILAAASDILRRYRPDAERQPHLVVRIDDPRHADHWRGRHSATSAHWFEDALSPQESTARALVRHVGRTGARQLLLCGDSTVALAVLLELARCAWERRGLAEAAALGRRQHPEMVLADEPGEQSRALRPVEHIVLLDNRARDLRREYLSTAPRSMTGVPPAIEVRALPWKDHLLATLDAMTPFQESQTAVVVADPWAEDTLHEAGRVARLHPRIPVFVLSSDGAGSSEPTFDLLRPFQRALLIDGALPEDAWTRMARHWHECYRLRHPTAPGDPRSAARRPWADLDEFIRQDNILQLRSVMTAVVGRGRRWVPARAVAPGSFIELSGLDLEAIAQAEHTRWYERRRGAGWRPADRKAGRERSSGTWNPHVNSNVIPWADLPEDDQAGRVESVRSQLTQLEEAGFMPVVPGGGPAGAEEFQRVGAVRARRLNVRRPWTRRSGDQLCGDAGDWRVIDEAGDERTVRDLVFRTSHEPLGGDRWNRTGTYRAWQVGERLVVRTIEGDAVARPGDWVVEGSHGERWPVTHEQFQRTYRPLPSVRAQASDGKRS
jgi:hypothetical protein